MNPPNWFAAPQPRQHSHRVFLFQPADKVQLLPQIIYEKVSMPEEGAAIQTPRCAGENTSVWEEMGTLLLQHCHFGIFQELYTHLSTPWGSRHHEIRDDGCSISNSKSYCDFNWIPAAILFFFPEPLDSLFLPCCQRFSSLFLTALIPPRDSFSFLSSSACDSSYPDLWCLGLSLFLLNRNLSQTRFGFQAPPLFQPWEVLTLYWSILSLSSADDSVAGIKKGDRKMETWSPEDQKQAVTPGT